MLLCRPTAAQRGDNRRLPLNQPPSAAWAEGKPRFTVCYQLRSYKHRHRIRLEIELPEADPRLPSLAGLWPAFNWQERSETKHLMYGLFC